MPIWLRKWTFQTMQEYYKEQQEATKEAYSKNSNKQKGQLNRPNIKPSYRTKASNK
jgi:hypothetical protein